MFFFRSGKDENPFSEQSIRLGFIQKVYAILMVQMMIIMAIIAVFLFVKGLNHFSWRHPEMFIIAGVLTFALMIALVWFQEARRTYPANFICFGLFTILESFLLGAIASHYNSDGVFIAVGICMAICKGLTLFAFQTKYDFTWLWGIYMVSAIATFCFGILVMYFQDKAMQIVFASLGALLFSLYLVTDTQLLMGGKHMYSISPEEYLFAALNLYLDIIYLFLYLLQFIAQKIQKH